MKKLLILLMSVSLVLSFSLASCKKKEEVSKEAPGYGEKAPGYGEKKEGEGK